MLGTHATAALYGQISRRGVYAGYLCNGPAKGKSAYILASKTPCEQFDCTVIALAPQPGGKEVKIIVAPENDVFYEPQIREKLKSYAIWTFPASPVCTKNPAAQWSFTAPRRVYGFYWLKTITVNIGAFQKGTWKRVKTKKKPPCAKLKKKRVLA